MAGNNQNRLERNSFARPRAQSLSSLRILQSSDSIPLIPRWDINPNHPANSTTSQDGRSFTSSRRSSLSLRPTEQAAGSTGTFYVGAQSTWTRQAMPFTESQQPAGQTTREQRELDRLQRESIPMTSTPSHLAPQPSQNQPPGNTQPVNPTAEHQPAEQQPAGGGTAVVPNTSSITPQAGTGNSQPANLLTGQHPAPTEEIWKEWKSRKIGWPWLSFLLFATVSLISATAALDVVSRRNSGFFRLSDPPAFLTHNPALEKAIWTQGILYTAVPAFIMTVYRIMWESSVAAFADRQPYVDLRKDGGGPLRSTIMLDYKAEPFLYGWIQALRNKHLLLAACMLCSVVLTLLVIPLASFLITDDTFASNTPLPLYFDTSFNSNILGDYPILPDLRLPLMTAAAMHIQEASRPPWTDGEYASPKFVPLVEVGDGNTTIEATAYSAQSDCVYIEEPQYRKKISNPGDTGIPALVIEITADDRGCQIENSINIRFTPEAPHITVRVWTTIGCAADAGWSRFSILTAMHTDTSTDVRNSSLISCKPSYWITLGTLVAATGSTSTLFLKAFAPHPSNTSQFRPEALWRTFEMGIQDPGCFDPLSNVDSNEFGNYLYKIASKRNPSSPLLPEAIIGAAQTLFVTTFAVFASTVLFKPTPSPLNATGVYSVEETRLIVQSPVAYIIISVLAAVAISNISLFFYTRQESMLYEEPVGLLSTAWILNNSAVNTLVAGLAQEANFKGKMKEAAIERDQDDPQYYYFDGKDRIIKSLTSPSQQQYSRPWLHLWTWVYSLLRRLAPKPARAHTNHV